jgi:O-antigen ligase
MGTWAPAEPRSRSRLLYRVLAFPMFVAAFVTLPRKLNFGPISGLGLLTLMEVGLIAAGLLACTRYPKWLLLRTLPYLCFMVWVGLSTIWAPPAGIMGFQNGLLYLLFGLMILLAGTLAARDAPRLEKLIDQGILWISSVALAFVALDMSLRGLPKDTEEGWWIGPRPLAILGLVVLSRYLARWYYGDRTARLWILLWIAAIVGSISRTATAGALILVACVVLAQMRFHRRRVAFTLPAALGAVVLVVTLAFTWAPFHDRMFAGDTKLDVGGTSINVSGRRTMWMAVIESARKQPIVGSGLGSAQLVVAETMTFMTNPMSQPHNDYLRIWHDLGAIGLVLHLAAAAAWMGTLGLAWYRSERTASRAAQLELTGLLALLGLSIMEVTDNPVVYQGPMAMAGLLVGAGLGARLYYGSSRFTASL